MTYDVLDEWIMEFVRDRVDPLAGRFNAPAESSRTSWFPVRAAGSLPFDQTTPEARYE